MKYGIGCLFHLVGPHNRWSATKYFSLNIAWYNQSLHVVFSSCNMSEKLLVFVLTEEILDIILSWIEIEAFVHSVRRPQYTEHPLLTLDFKGVIFNFSAPSYYKCLSTIEEDWKDWKVSIPPPPEIKIVISKIYFKTNLMI